jgi:cyanophycinase
MMLSKKDANDEGLVSRIRTAASIVVCDGSALHAKSVLKGSLALDAILALYKEGCLLIGLGAGAMVLSDPMIDPRGGALTVGLGVIDGCAVAPGVHGEMLHRTVMLAPKDLPIIDVPIDGGIVSDGGSWRTVGAPSQIYLAGQLGSLRDLPTLR